MSLFRNREEAAHELARNLMFLEGDRPIVLALANGGLPLAAVIADALAAPLDVLLIEKLTAPRSPGHVVGAVDERGRISMIQSTARWHHLKSQEMVEPAREKFRSLQRHRGRVRAVLPELDVRGRTVIVVGQGVATGARMLGAVASLRDRGAAKIVAAAPAGTEKASWQLHEAADLVVIPHRPSRFKGISEFYDEFGRVSDDLALALVQNWVASRPSDTNDVRTVVLKLIGTRQQLLCCEVDLPPDVSRGSGPYPAVIFAHGFESNGRSSRNLPISVRLAKRGIIGVRLDFTGHGRSEGSTEDATDIQMLEDLHLIHRGLEQLQEVDAECIGLVGSGTGGMVVLRYAAREPRVRALVIRGPVCGNEVEAAHRVRAPTLLIHADRDTALRASIETLDRELGATHELLHIKDSSRLFSDPISRELMVNASVDWLVDHLAPTAAEPPIVETVRPAEESRTPTAGGS